MQNGANSSVGQIITQLCRAWKVQVVGIVRSRPDIEELKNHLKNLGATEILTEEELKTRSIFESGTLPKPVLALNCVGGSSASLLMQQLAFRGTLVTYGGASKEPLSVTTPSLIYHDLKILGFWRTRWMQEHLQKPEMLHMFQDLFQLIADGKLKAPDHEFVPIENFKEALERGVQGTGFSNKKILLKF